MCFNADAANLFYNTKYPLRDLCKSVPVSSFVSPGQSDLVLQWSQLLYTGAFQAASDRNNDCYCCSNASLLLHSCMLINNSVANEE